MHIVGVAHVMDINDHRTGRLLLQYHEVVIHILLAYDPMMPCWTTLHHGFDCAFSSFNRFVTYLITLTYVLCSSCLSFPDLHLQYISIFYYD